MGFLPYDGFPGYIIVFVIVPLLEILIVLLLSGIVINVLNLRESKYNSKKTNTHIIQKCHTK